MTTDQVVEYVFAIEEGIKHKKIINKFQDQLISTMNNLETEGSTSETHNMNIRYKYSMDGLKHPSGLKIFKYLCEDIEFILV